MGDAGKVRLDANHAVEGVPHGQLGEFGDQCKSTRFVLDSPVQRQQERAK
jgi:hypothetical protein